MSGAVCYSSKFMFACKYNSFLSLLKTNQLMFCCYCDIWYRASITFLVSINTFISVTLTWLYFKVSVILPIYNWSFKSKYLQLDINCFRRIVAISTLPIMIFFIAASQFDVEFTPLFDMLVNKYRGFYKLIQRLWICDI